MYTGIKHLHSYLPYLLLAALAISVIVFLAKRSAGKSFTSADKRLALITLILTHLQLVAGLVLYFISPVVKTALTADDMMGDSTHRFYAVEHIGVMLVAIILITIGYSRAKRKTENRAKFQTLTIFYLLGLLLILLRIPWFAWPV
ncbi:MAG: hypothetical protein U5L96_16895 [Owenweeksia sp.]|nr:hypothetical protein [Owenweeksia sp.]